MNEKLEEMWTALSAHQPTADRLGYGVEWSRMCSERTPEAAALAANAVWPTAGADDANYAAYAADAARDVACAVGHSKRAIAYITKANGEQA